MQIWRCRHADMVVLSCGREAEEVQRRGRFAGVQVCRGAEVQSRCRCRGAEWEQRFKRGDCAGAEHVVQSR